MKKKAVKRTSPTPEYDSQRETRVLLEEMNQGIKIISEQHGTIVKKLEEHDERFDKMESEFNTMRLEFSSVKSTVDTVVSELSSVKSTVNTVVSELSSVKSTVNTVVSELSTVKSELSTVKMAVMEVDSKVDRLNIKLDINISQNEERFRRIEEKLEIT